MAKSAMVRDLSKRLEALEAKLAAVGRDRTLNKSQRAAVRRSLQLAASALMAKLRRTDALDPRQTISLRALEHECSTRAAAGDVILPKVGDIVSLAGVLLRVSP